MRTYRELLDMRTPECIPALSGSTPGETRTKVLVSIIIPVYNNWHYTQRCLESLRHLPPDPEREVIVVDNGSTDGTASRLAAGFPEVRVIRNSNNLGFAAACNQGAREANGQYLVFLNNDTEVKTSWLEALVAAAAGDQAAAVVGSKLLYPDGTIQHAGVAIRYASPQPLMPIHLGYGQQDKLDTAGPTEVDAVTGASMLVKREVFAAVGGFDERYKNGYEDVDLCLRVRRKGYRVIYQPSSVAIHYESKTPGRYSHVRENVALLHRLWMPEVVTLRKAANPIVPRPPISARPPVSVIVVTHDSLDTVAPCVESLLSTLGPNDEVIAVDRASKDETGYYLEILAGEERRLVVQRLQGDGGYVAAAAKGVQLAKNDFLIFVHPDAVVCGSWIDELLRPMLKDDQVGATGPVSNCAAGLQNLELYAPMGGTQISVEQVREYLARQWGGKNIETKLLTGFCLAMRREALEKIGGLDEALYLGNDDLDLSWRLQQAGYKQVVVPSVFVYHQGQASFNTEPKVRTKYLVQQSTNQLYEKLYAAYGGKVPSGQELWDISWFTPQQELLSIVIPVHKDPEATRQCLDSIVRHTHRPHEIIVVDNAADNETKRVLEEFAQRLDNLIVITNDANLGYPRACNQGIEAATGEYIAVMNNDVILTPYWASRLLAAFAVDPQVGAVGPRTNYAVGPQRVETANYTLAELDQWAAGWHRDHAGNLMATGRLIGFLVVLKRQLVDDIGGFDPLFGVGNFEDDDLSLRALLKDYKLVIAEDVFIHHHGSRSFGSIPQKYLRLMDTNGKLFAAKWGVRLDKGAYNPGDVLNQRGRYGRAELYIPLSFESMFTPDVEALDVGTGAPNRLLCVPDPSDPLESWLDLFRNYFAAFGDGRATAGSATSASQAATIHKDTAYGEQEAQGQITGGERSSQALIIRAEPAEQSWVDRLVDGLRSVAKEIDIDLDKRDDLVVEARSIPSAMRGQVYRAATVFVPLPGVRRESLVREAEACGLRVLSGYTPQELVGAVLGEETAGIR